MHNENRFLDTFRGHNIRPIILTQHTAYNFDTTGLPKFVQGSWMNANKLLEKSRIKDHPFFEKKKLVASLTSDRCHDVT